MAPKAMKSSASKTNRAQIERSFSVLGGNMTTDKKSAQSELFTEDESAA